MASIEQLLSGLASQVGDKAVYCKGNIPAKKSQGAISAYAQAVTPDQILVLVDDTVFGSATDGFLLTQDAVYARNMGENPRKLPLVDIETVAFNSGRLGRSISINDSFLLRLNMPGNEALQRLAQFIEQLAGLKKSSPSQAVAAPVVATQKPSPAAAPSAVSRPTASVVSASESPAVLKPLSGEVISATATTEYCEAGKACLDLSLKLTNNTGQAISRIRSFVTVCSAQGHIIGTEASSPCDVEWAQAEDREHEQTVTLDIFGIAAPDALKDAAIYVSVLAEVERKIAFNPAMVSQAPVNLTPRNPQEFADRIKVLRATAFIRPEPDAPCGAQLTIRAIVQNVKGIALDEAVGIRFTAPEFTDDSAVGQLQSLLPGAVRGFECEWSEESFSFRKTPSVELAAELVFYESAGIGWIKHKGITMEAVQDSADDDLLGFSSDDPSGQEEAGCEEVPDDESGDSDSDEEKSEGGPGASGRLEVAQIYFNLSTSKEAQNSIKEAIAENEGYVYVGYFEDEGLSTRGTVSKLKDSEDRIVAWQIEACAGGKLFDSFGFDASPGFKMYGGFLPDTPVNRTLEEALSRLSERHGLDREIFYWAAIHPEQVTDYGDFLSEDRDDCAIYFQDARGRVDREKTKAFLNCMGRAWFIYELHFDDIDFASKPLDAELLSEEIGYLDHGDSSFRRVCVFVRDNEDKKGEVDDE